MQGAELVHDQDKSRAALFDDGRLVEFWPFAAHGLYIGAICLARVTQIFAKQNRAQCQLADGTDASFRIDASAKIAPGDLCWITLQAQGRQHKPWQAHHAISRAGQLLVLHYGKRFVRASHKAGTDLSDEMRQSLESALPEGWGMVIKRAGLEASQEALLAETSALLTPLGDDFKDKLAQADTAMAPHVIYHGDDVGARIAINRYGRKIRCETDTDYWADITHEASALCAPQVICHNGAVLHFEQTQAVLAVDVDSAQSRLAPYPLAKSVAKQIMQILRLGCYSGVVVIDMPRLRHDDMADILTILRQAAKADQRHPEVLGLSRAGLIELKIRHRDSLLQDRLDDKTLKG